LIIQYIYLTFNQVVRGSRPRDPPAFGTT